MSIPRPRRVRPALAGAGLLRISLVAVPVKAYSAVSSDSAPTTSTSCMPTAASASSTKNAAPSTVPWTPPPSSAATPTLPTSTS